MPRPQRPTTHPDTASGENPDEGASFLFAGRRIAAGRPQPGLHVVATPIGSLADITLRALETLAGADLILCEDTRVTRKLTTHYGIKTPLAAYHEHNAAEMRPKIMARLNDGARLALVSDAGTPLVSDPGFKLVRDALGEGAPVTAAPGPSAVLTALVLSGLPTDRFFFEGFLPPKSHARQARIAEIARIPATLVLFETGPRVAGAMADLAAGLGPRPAVLARELTKRFEEVRRGSLQELAAGL
ncbi:MAG: 16S rRNA (cytidine(1402)-2'-O)-methyltransferase, partial [Hansschlegelia sp.]